MVDSIFSDGKLPTPLGFVNNCQYFLISRSDLEGAYRKAFLVCKSGRCCHPRWMGSGDGLRDVREKWGAVKFVSPMPNTRTCTRAHTHTLLSVFFHLSLLGATPLVSKFPPIKWCPNFTNSFVLCSLFLSFFASLSGSAKGFFGWWVNWWAVLLFNYLGGREVYSSAAAESFLFLKVSISSLQACCNLQHHANSHGNSMNPKLTWPASIFPH